MRMLMWLTCLSVFAVKAVAVEAWTAKKDFGDLRQRLTTEQYRVTKEEGTEPPFTNAFWNEHGEGLYVDVISGEPLFSSRDKYDSGTGWPSFKRPLPGAGLENKTDRSLFAKRTEVRTRLANSHLGHVFDDGPAPTHQRYCMNSAALKFIPKAKMAELGYGAWIKYVQP